MDSLMNARAGDMCTIKWMIGDADIMDRIRGYDIKEGTTVQVVQSTARDVIISRNSVRLALGSEIAQRIKI